VNTRIDSASNSGRPWRIAVVTETFPPEVNGVAHSIARFSEGLLARGVRLQIVRPRQPGETPPWHCPQADHLLVSGMSLPNYSAVRIGLPAQQALLQSWNANRPDIVHLVTEGPLGWSALRSAGKLGIPVTSSFHTNFHGYASHYGAAWFARMVMAYLRRFHNRTRLTIVPTTQIRDELAARGIQRLAVVGRGVDTRLFNPARRSEALRARFNARADVPLVLHVGRLASEKNLGVLFDAFARVHRNCPAAQLVVVGDGPLRAKLQRAHPQHHFTGMLTGVTLAEHYASADMFLYPSLTETFGNVTLEAMASGLAVVAFDYAAAREHLRHMENGALAPYGDAAGFTQMAAVLARTPRRMQMLRREARTTAESLDWDSVNDRFLNALLSTIDHPAPAANGAYAGNASAAA